MIETPTLTEPRVAQAVALAYAYIERPPESPPIERLLESGIGTERGATSREATGAESVVAVLGNVRHDPEAEILSGRLGFVEPTDAHAPTFDEYSNDFEFKPVGGSSAVWVEFAIDLRTYWMVLEDNGHVPPRNACLVIEQLANGASPSARVAVHLAEREEALEDFLANVNTVVSVQFAVHPSNPHTIFEDLDKEMARSRAAKLTVRAENPDGLRPPKPGGSDEPDLLEMGIGMVEEGYGEDRGYLVRGSYVFEREVVRVEFDGYARTSTIRDDIGAHEAEESYREGKGFVAAMVRRLRRLAKPGGLLARWAH